MVSQTESLALGAHHYAPGDVVAAKYRLEQALGEGGMGTVWRALNLQLEAPVALKLVRAGLDRNLLTERLKQEARAAAKLGHPAIVRIFDVGETEFGDPFIVMELLNGRTLASLLATERRLASVRALQLLLPVADALAAAHAKGIIHRDLKPDNVFIAIENERVQPKLVDFGIVKLAVRAGEVDRHLTQAGSVLGSPEYMSPEQARGREDIDHRTDIWSFAVLLYETLAGVTPFNGTSYNALLRSIVEDEPPSLRDHMASDEQLWAIIGRGLAKDVTARYGSMNEFGCALAGWLLAQGVFEDVSGGSLEAKWIARDNDSFSTRASRASFSSLSPESGVRALSGNLSSAPTLGLPALPSLPAQAARTTPSATGVSRLAQRALLTLGFFSVLALTVTLVMRRGVTEPPLVQATPRVTVAEPPSPVVVAPVASAALAFNSAAPADSAATQAPVSTTRPTNAHALPVHPRAAPSPPARAAHPVKPGDPSGDLLTPY